MAARCASISAHADGRARRASARRRAARARAAQIGFDDIATYARFRRQVQRTKRKLLSFLIDGQGRGQAHLRLRRAGQGQHAAQLLRHRHRLPRLHRRPQSLQARPLHAGHAHSDPAGRGHRRGQAGLPAHPALEPEGRDRRARCATSATGAASSSCRFPNVHDHRSAAELSK